MWGWTNEKQQPLALTGGSRGWLGLQERMGCPQKSVLVRQCHVAQLTFSRSKWLKDSCVSSLVSLSGL